MNNQRGLTLIEVLASITLLAVISLAVIYTLQQSTLFSKKNSDKENSVLIARTVMESIKSGLKSGSSVELYGNTVSLSPLRLTNQSALSALYLPDSIHPKMRIDIRTLPISNDTVSVQSKSYHIANYFRLVEVTATDITTNQAYSLKAYVEYQ